MFNFRINVIVEKQVSCKCRATKSRCIRIPLWFEPEKEQTTNRQRRNEVHFLLLFISINEMGTIQASRTNANVRHQDVEMCVIRVFA